MGREGGYASLALGGMDVTVYYSAHKTAHKVSNRLCKLTIIFMQIFDNF